jgi:hypothetical protein
MAVRFKPACPTATHDRDNEDCCGPERCRLSTPNRQVAGSSPARSSRAPVAQLVEQSGPCSHDRSSLCKSRVGEVRLSLSQEQREGREPSARETRVSHRSSHHDRGAFLFPAAGRSGTVIGRAPGSMPGGAGFDACLVFGTSSSETPLYDATTAASLDEGALT